MQSQSSEEMVIQKTPTQSGIDGPYRNRSVVENFVWRDENGDYPE
jgi:glutaminyl-tRNA synthetase